MKLKISGILKAGVVTDSRGMTINFTPEILEGIAGGYDPNVFEAPLILSHDQNDETPPFGGVKSLQFNPESGAVDAYIGDLYTGGGAQIMQMRNFSASIYLPDSAGNPKPGALYLRHIAGVLHPAIKGQAEPMLALAELIPEGEVMDLNIEGQQGCEKCKTPDAKALDLAERIEEISKKEAELKQRESAISLAESEIVTQDINAFLSGMKGKMLPAQVTLARDILTVLKPASISLSEKSQSPYEMFKQFLSKMQGGVVLSEVSGDSKKEDTDPTEAQVEERLKKQGAK